MKAVNLLTPEHEHEFEAAHGLPEALPAGETLLWQGSPNARLMTRQALHFDLLLVYFGTLVAWSGITAWYDGAALAQTLIAMGRASALFALALGLLSGIGWLIARTSVYTITDRRIVMRIGVVLSITFNLPFKQIESAAVRRHGKSGAGDIVLSLGDADRIAYLHLWPHVRPWQLRRTQPMLRALAQADAVAEMLAAALQQQAAGSSVRAPALPVRAVHTGHLQVA